MNSCNASMSDSHNISTNINTSQCCKDSSRTSKFYFKPFRLKDITQEILDAENEPLKAIPLIDADLEESNEDEIELNRNIVESVDKKCDELGTVLETPRKVNILSSSEFPYGNTLKNESNSLFSSTPRVPYSLKEFLTPSFKNISSKSSHNFNLKVPLSTPKHIEPHSKSTHTDEKMPVKVLHSNLNNNKQNSIKCDGDKENSSKINLSDMKEICVNGKNYLILNQLGKGGSSVVYHCYNVHTKVERAIKKVNLESDINRIGYLNEVNILSQLRNSDRIIHMYDFEFKEAEKTLLVVLEKGECDLAKMIKDSMASNRHLPLYIIIGYWMEMLYAVQQIHNNGIIHSDLKPENFLLVNGRLKLIDFGIATCIQEDMTSAIRTCQVGSFQYISPEALINQPSRNIESPDFGKPAYKLKFKTDVWSLGCIFYQLIYQRTPFQHINHMWAKLTAIMDPNHKIDYPSLDWVPEKIINTIKSCLQYEIIARPSIAELIKDYEDVYFVKET